MAYKSDLTTGDPAWDRAYAKLGARLAAATGATRNLADLAAKLTDSTDKMRALY